MAKFGFLVNITLVLHHLFKEKYIKCMNTLRDLNICYLTSNWFKSCKCPGIFWILSYYPEFTKWISICNVVRIHNVGHVLQRNKRTTRAVLSITSKPTITFHSVQKIHVKLKKDSKDMAWICSDDKFLFTAEKSKITP